MRAIAVSGLFALLCACSPLESGMSMQDLRLHVEPESVSAGDTVVLVLENRSSGPIGYNLCTSQLERQSGSDWRAVPSDRICTMELRTLGAGEDARYPLELPAGLQPGDYRYSTAVERLATGERSGVAGEPFRVVP